MNDRLVEHKNFIIRLKKQKKQNFWKKILLQKNMLSLQQIVSS